MRKILTIAFLMIFTLKSFAQTTNQSTNQEEMVSVPKSQLTEQQKQNIATQNIDNTIQTAAKWTGLGREIGDGVNGALSALTHQADTLSNTKVGKFTMFIIAYKIIGSDVIQFLIGTPLLIMIIIMSVIFYRNNVRTRRFITNEKRDPLSGKMLEIEYDVKEFNGDVAWAWAIVSAIAIALCILIILV